MSTSNSALTSSNIKQVYQLMSTLIFMIGLMYTIGQAAAQVTGTGVKWHPGHYYELVGQVSKGDSGYLNNVYQELQQTPALNGIVVRYRWGELETSTPNVYDFSAIERRLAELAVLNKRLIVLIETKSNTPDVEDTLVPSYAKTALYEGGIYPYDASASDGYGTKLWNANIRWRLTRLVRELGKRFNSEPYFEGVGFSESATGKPAVPLTSAQVDAFYANLQTLNKELKNSFPNSMTFQYLNYPRNILASFIDIFKQKGIALGNPDVFLDDAGLNFPGTKYSPPGVYTYYPKLAGTIPLVVQVEKANYLNTRHDNTGYQPTVEELFTFARDTLQVNYLFWTRTPTFYPKVLELLNYNAQKNITAGGLKSECPTVYSSCIQ